MSPKKKEIVWHKKKNKFIDSSLTKPHHLKDEDKVFQVKMDRRQTFAKVLSENIKRAIQNSSE